MIARQRIEKNIIETRARAKSDTSVLSQVSAEGTARSLWQSRSGNRVVQRLVRSGAAGLIQAKPCACGATCPQCRPYPLQAKLRVSSPDDPFEREADRVADQIMRMPDPKGQGLAPLVQRQADAEEEDELKARIQAKAVESGMPTAAGQVEDDVALTAGSGQPLPGSVRTFFERRFGVDFGDVRVHTGAEAAASARVLRARAFTVGRDIVFGENEYRPDGSEGRRLLAHELTHTIQQGASCVGAARAAKIFRQGTPGAQTIPPQCAGARGNWTFLIRSSGIGMGAAYVKEGGTLAFHNLDTRAHQIRISPPHLVSSATLTVPAGSKVVIFVNRIGRVEGGSIIDSPGPGQTVHDFVVCP